MQITVIDNAKHQEQRIVDARLEHQQLITSFHLLMQIVWISYGAYFAVNTLLFTILGATFTETAAATIKYPGPVRVTIALVGIATACTSVYVAFEIWRLRKLNNARGQEVEQVVLARTFHRLEAFSNSPPIASYFGSFTFAAIWIAILTGVLQTYR
ncbi:hypothetical protein QTH97_16570 [Variovorax sp. J22R24]|uniref:hypothetical protein n=1 Tax=Variovorax gracilis TaxID=3053502 RepID=UPI0025790B9A|nr:hypothetical protein [Variovorax sp. J22R24]MDM0106562.1 hypothetical protein [Variovorax sp. J22R24]